MQDTTSKRTLKNPHWRFPGPGGALRFAWLLALPSGSARASRSARTHSVFPPRMASWSGVACAMFGTFTSAPAAASSFTMSVLPLRAALRGVGRRGGSGRGGC